MCFQGRWSCLPLAIFDLSLKWWAPYKACQVLVDKPPQSFLCWLWGHSCHRSDLIYTFLHLLFCWSTLCHVIAKRNSSSTFVCTLDLACNLLRLKSFRTKRYLIGIPLSPSWKASVSMAENIMLNRVGAIKQLCLTPFVTGNGSENSPLFWTRASIPSWNCLTIAMNLVGQPNFAIIFQRPSRLTVSNALVRSTKIV